MIKLSTPVDSSPLGFVISHNNSLMFLGSCFAENMGTQMQQLGFSVSVNPFGILYNPLSMAEAMRRCLDDEAIGEEKLVFYEGLWHSWLHHGAFSRRDKQECLDVCNESIHSANDFLKTCDTLVVTFGSAWAYVLDDGLIVANCHKVPASRFSKRLLSVDEVVTSWLPLTERLLQQGKRIVFTVSPVRHLAYGAHGNQLGKAVLLLAIEEMLAKCAKGIAYFPAYEIVVDELRDYRFYADDMAHPSPLAERVVWQRFQESCMSSETIEKCRQRELEIKRQNHRPLHGGT
ncbi:MAG: GSCFA domain-containing protein [Bacteroidales bacterium]|nr:GSCFA domain-containing protein [Bacteroidales bacterium]